MLNFRIQVCLPVLLGSLLFSPPRAAAEPDAHDAARFRRSHANGQNQEAAKTEDAKSLGGTIPDAASKPVLTSNSVVIAGQRVGYSAETGMLPLLTSDGTVRASVFYVAYVRRDADRPERRPLMFCFNGGPGSSSVWLHLGALGPRRVKLGEPDATQPVPFGLVDNEFSILDVADLVFIDPVDTGFSRPDKTTKAEEFFGESSDIQSVGEFIRLWTTRNHRWLSPKYLCGESYGALRAAGLAHHLHSRYGMTLSGVILISGLLDYDAPTSQVLLPAYTATAHFHRKLPPDLQADLPKALAEARQFMRTEYASVWFQGASLSAAERSRVVAELSRLTGLPARVIEDNDLRIAASAFCTELLRDQGLVLGRHDGRITGREMPAALRSAPFDPSLSGIDGAFSAAVNAYLREDLKFTDDLPYLVLGPVGPWSHEPQGSVMNDFAAEMRDNPRLRVLVLNGRCDLVCPVDLIRYNIDHLKLDSAYRARIAYAEYESGHMMYINLPDLKKMQKDLEQFVRKDKAGD
jgi:carboxypeptidase C (cathepsin A)